MVVMPQLLYNEGHSWVPHYPYLILSSAQIILWLLCLKSYITKAILGSPITPIESIDIHCFHSIVLPSDEDLLEAMVKTHEHSSLSLSRSLKNETHKHEHSSFSMSRSLKNDKPVYPLSSSLYGEPIPISSQESNRV
jgi:hypothetical protein